MTTKPNVQLILVLPAAELHSVAREARAKMAAEEWQRLVGFALEVIRLEEAEQTQVEYWVAPRSVG